MEGTYTEDKRAIRLKWKKKKKKKRLHGILIKSQKEQTVFINRIQSASLSVQLVAKWLLITI